MSVKSNQKLNFWKDVLTSLRCIPSYREGIELSDRDSETISQSILLNCSIITDIAHHSTLRADANLKRWCIIVKRLDIDVVDQTMKEMLLFCRLTGPTSYDCFKRSLKSENQVIGALVAPILDILKEFLSSPCARLFRILNQFFSFMSRITLLDVNFSAQALEDYYATDKRLADHVYGDDDVSAVREVLQEWFRDFRLKEIRPNHGPGGIAEYGRTTAYEKYAAVRLDQKSRYLLKYTDLETTIFDPEVDSLPRESKVVFVPKDTSKMRTICMEPASLMYLQQGCWGEIDKFMRKHPEIKKHINLKDQSINRRLSMLGSLHNSYATIDLSAASDSVSWRLVKRLFTGTDYYKACLLTRSEKVNLPDGNQISPQMFAPMGSALCFPTECLVFAAICEAVVRAREGRRFYSVYGDDIVIAKSDVPELIRVLNSLGFLVNTSKSYTEGPFRESCGGEYYQGIDVTPVKVPRNYKGATLSSHTPGLFECLVEFANTCYDAGFKSARVFLIQRLLDLPKPLRPLFDDGTRGLKSDNPTNFHLCRRYIVSTQRWVVQHGSTGTVPKEDPLLDQQIKRRSIYKKKCLLRNKNPFPERIDDELTLFMWHRSASVQREPRLDLFEIRLPTTVRRDFSHQKLKTKWTTDYFLCDIPINPPGFIPEDLH